MGILTRVIGAVAPGFALRRARNEAALKALLKAKPYLVKVEQVTAPETNARNGRQKEDAAAREEELKRRYRIGV